LSVFTQAEIQYLNSQRLGRLATVGPDGQPHVVPLAFRYNPEHDTVDISGHDFAKRKKWRDVNENPKVALVVDDLVSTQPWKPRGIEIRGEAEVLHSGGKAVNPYFNDEMFRIRPKRIYTWGLVEGEERLGGSGRDVGG
jgi:pyridoxamine 5'-phosphate oxidase family protein